ncbi:MAG: NAD(P)-dependent oxidoreductase [Bacteroidota bacterium]
MKTVLITGASGFIGSFLAEEGINRNYKVFAAIRKSSSRQYLQDTSVNILEFDFSSEKNLIDSLNDCKERGIHFDYIIHNAGVTKAQKKGDFYRVNYLQTCYFVEALRKTAMIPEKFILISSLAAYGPGSPVTMEPVRLDQVPNPVELYGKSKLEAEKFMQSQIDFPWIIIRPTGVYGPREKDYFIFFQTINRGLETYIGSKKQILTFIYVKDLVKLIFAAVESQIVHKGYFAADGKEYDSVEFSSIAKKHLGKRTIKIVVPKGLVKQIAYSLEKICGLWGTIPTLNSDKYQVLASSNWRCETRPLEEDFGFVAEYDLDKGVKETIQWYRKEKWLS